jgi:hypothetical protein
MERVLTVLVAGVVCMASPLRAQAAASRTLQHCQGAALTELRRINPNADSVRLEPNPTTRMAMNQGGEVRGRGAFFDWNVRQSRRFTYVCAYRIQTAQARVDIQVDSVGPLIR